MKKLIICGHSCCHIRQRMLGETTAKLGVKTIVIGPKDWNDEHYELYTKKNFFFRPLPIAGSPSFYSFNLKKFLRTLSAFRPATIYCMEEMFTLFARECMKYAKDLRCPLWFFTWENKVGFRLSSELDRIEQEAIRAADGIICGNSLARERMLKLGADKDKLHVLLQSGIDTELFKPMDKIKKEYEIIFHGRLIREKGLPFLENVCRDLNLKLLTVGGRGPYQFKYGDTRGWIDYEELPKIINSAKIGVQVPFSYKGYQEQGNFSAGECGSCALPVVISNNGSLVENYGDSPFLKIDEGDENQLKEKITEITENDEKRVKLGIESRRWIEENLSLEVIGKKLLEIMELM